MHGVEWEHRDLARRLRRFLAGRLVFVGIALVLILVLEYWAGAPAAPGGTLRPAYTTLLGVAVITLFGFLWAATGYMIVLQCVVHLAVDVGAVTLLVYFTGIDQVFAYLYFAAVISAATVLSMRAALFAASAATTCLAIVSLAQTLAPRIYFLGIEIPAGRPGGSIRSDVVILASFAVSLHLVAFLSGMLVRRMHGLRSVHEETLQNMTGGVVTLNRDGTVEFANQRAIALLGLGAARAVRGAPALRVLPAPLAEMARSALEHGRESREEYRAGERLVEATVAPLRNAGRGGVRGAVLTLHDVTVREQLERARRTAERLRAFADLSATIAHELRNPLASIRGAAQELATTRPEDADERTLLSVLVREADRLDRIIRDFLDYASERALELRRVSVGDLLEEVAVLLRARVSEQTNEAISIRCEADAGAVAQLDLDRMKQVLLNLGINALEAIGGQGHVVLRARREEAQDDGKGRVCIEVEDDGPGIPPDVQERIFDPYFTTKPGGTGMGLAIVERIVRAHGGEISVHSRPGRGTTFRIRLPASP